jgi:hypothetical protein
MGCNDQISLMAASLLLLLHPAHQLKELVSTLSLTPVLPSALLHPCPPLPPSRKAPPVEGPGQHQAPVHHGIFVMHVKLVFVGGHRDALLAQLGDVAALAQSLVGGEGGAGRGSG